MKMPELRRKLKEARVELKAQQNTWGIMTLEANVIIGYDNCRITAQCNDLMHHDSNPDYSHYRETKTHLDLDFPGYGGTYAAKMKFEKNFGYSNYDAQICLNIFDILTKEIDKKNLGYKYKDCQLSQILEALEGLGVYRTHPDAEGTPLHWEWRTARRKAWKEFESAKEAETTEEEKEVVNG